MDKNLIINRYKEQRQEIQDYMRMFVNSLDQKYGDVPEEFIVSLDLISFNLEVLFKSVDEMKEKGMTDVDKYRGEKKSSNLQAFFNAQNYITKLISQFGFSPASAAKINKMNLSDAVKDDEKLLENIIDV